MTISPISLKLGHQIKMKNALIENELQREKSKGKQEFFLSVALLSPACLLM
jgi:hypothetical protein